MMFAPFAPLSNEQYSLDDERQVTSPDQLRPNMKLGVGLLQTAKCPYRAWRSLEEPLRHARAQRVRTILSGIWEHRSAGLLVIPQKVVTITELGESAIRCTVQATNDKAERILFGAHFDKLEPAETPNEIPISHYELGLAGITTSANKEVWQPCITLDLSESLLIRPRVQS